MPWIRRTIVRRVPEIDVEWRKGKPCKVPGNRAPVSTFTIKAARGIEGPIRIRIEYGKQIAQRVKGMQEAILVNCEQFVGKIAWCIVRTTGHILWANRESLKVRRSSDSTDERGDGRVAINRKQVAQIIHAVERVSHESHARGDTKNIILCLNE